MMSSVSATAELQPHRLSVARKVGFTIGDYGFNLYWQSVSLFLMFYYTDAIGLSATTAGLIYMAASIFDGVTDPIMGAFADRTRTRWGRYRPYILWGTIPLALSFAALYYKPALDAFGITAVVCASHFLFRACYTVSSIPYISLTARVTSSSSERSTIAGFRMIFANLAGMTVSYSTQPLVEYFGGGDQARGFFYVACVIAILASCMFPIVYASTREPAPTHDEPIPRLRDYWVTLRHNHAFWIVVIGVLGGSVATTTLSKTVIYYFKYFLDAEASARYALTAKTGLAILIVVSWVYVTRFIGKRHAWFVTTAWGWAVPGMVLLRRREHGALGHDVLRRHARVLGRDPSHVLVDAAGHGRIRRVAHRRARGIAGVRLRDFLPEDCAGSRGRTVGRGARFRRLRSQRGADAADAPRHEDDHHTAAGRRYGDRRGSDVFLSATTGVHEKIVAELAARRDPIR